MRAFNFILSQQRFTVERAVGILIRRWGCLWSVFERLERNCLIMIIVCVKLHNICVDRWRKKNPGSRPMARAHVSDRSGKWGGCISEDAIDVQDADIMERLENKYEAGAPHRGINDSLRFVFYEKKIHGAGIHFLNDDDFLKDEF